jgi:hypothetical protein
MPSGGLMQLASYGSEDLYLTGNPQVTFFKLVYQRHTNFAYEWIPQYFDPQSSFSTTSNTQMNVPLKRDGDLIRDVALVIDFPDIYSSMNENFKWIEHVGEILVHYADFIIAGQRISRSYGQWLNIWNELITPSSHKQSYNELVGNVPEITNPLIYYGDRGTTTIPTVRKRRLRIPLSFWFTENPGLAIPLISLQYVEARIFIEFRQLNDLFTVGTPPISPENLFDEPLLISGSNHGSLRTQFLEEGYGPETLFWKFVNGQTTPNGQWNQNVYLDVKYVYLDSNERKLFASASHEYLITQPERLVFTGLNGGNNREQIDFYHPVKEMIWVFQRDDVSVRNQWTNYTTLPNDKDFPKLIELVNAKLTAETLGFTPNDISNVLLPSGMTVDQFIDFFNCTDTSQLSSTNISAFDQYVNIFYFGKFIFNQHDRQADKSHYYYAYQEPYNSHTFAPGVNKQIYMMSFSENPEMAQPSGTANFSRFNKAEFQFTLKNRNPTASSTEENCPATLEEYNLYFYVRNYNVLRFLNGIAGLVFAN